MVEMLLVGGEVKLDLLFLFGTMAPLWFTGRGTKPKLNMIRTSSPLTRFIHVTKSFSGLWGTWNWDSLI